MTKIPGMDMETYSEAGYYRDEPANRWRSVVKTAPHGLGAVGAAAYAEHPSTEILKMAWDLLDGNGPQIWRLEDGDPRVNRPESLCRHIESGGVLEFTNDMFEYWMWHYVAHLRYGWPALPLSQVRDAAAKSRNYSMPPGLADFPRILNVPVLKADVGKRLIAKYTHPTTRVGWVRKYSWDDPEDNRLFEEYNVDDVRAQMLASDKMPDLPPEELESYYYSGVINVRGAHVNRELLNACIDIIRQATEKYTAELQGLTNGFVKTVDELKNLQTWLAIYGVNMPNMQKATVTDALTWPHLPDVCRRALEIRASLNSASVKKLFALDRMLPTDNRMKGLFVYQKADRSGRWGGVGPQAHNIPGGGPPVHKCESCGGYFRPAVACPYCDSMLYDKSKWSPDAVVWAHQAIMTQRLDVVETYYGDAVKTVSGCLRSLYSAAPGCDLLSSDYSAIEAVVQAMISGETWRQEVFRTHGKIYEMSASKITGMPFEEFLRYKEETGNHHPYRGSIGKIAELASGYGGWIGAWKNFGADEHFSSDYEIKDAILKWRAESPNIVEFWGGQIRHGAAYGEHWYENYGIEGAVVSAIQNWGQRFEYKGFGVDVVDDVLRIQLLSGRYLYYHQPRLEPTLDRFSKQPIWQITYMGYNTDSTKGRVGWIRMETYGGKLFENIVQAVARDILGYALVNLEKSVCRETWRIEQFPMAPLDLGVPEINDSLKQDNYQTYAVVMHVHDEIVCEVPEGFGSVEEMERIMSTMPAWAADWPVVAKDGWRGKFFRKG